VADIIAGIDVFWGQYVGETDINALKDEYESGYVVVADIITGLDVFGL